MLSDYHCNHVFPAHSVIPLSLQLQTVPNEDGFGAEDDREQEEAALRRRWLQPRDDDGFISRSLADVNSDLGRISSNLIKP